MTDQSSKAERVAFGEKMQRMFLRLHIALLVGGFALMISRWEGDSTRFLRRVVGLLPLMFISASQVVMLRWPRARGAQWACGLLLAGSVGCMCLMAYVDEG